MLYNDNEFLKRLSENDEAIIREFIANNFDKLLAFVLKHGGNAEDAEDLMQDALVILYNLAKDREFFIEKNVNSYFRGIYKNLWYKRVRNILKIRNSEQNEDKFSKEDDKTIIDEIEKAERYKLYQKYYLQLNADCIEILKLLNEGVSVVEIIEKYNYTLSYFYKKKSLCKKELLENIMKDPKYKELKIK